MARILVLVVCLCICVRCRSEGSPVVPPYVNDPSGIPSSFRPSYDGSVLCRLGFYLDRFQDDCKYMDLSASNVAQDLSIMMCPKTPQWSSGTLVFRDASQRRPDTLRVYRVRLAGPEVLLLPITYCGAGMAVAPFSLTFGANYTIEVLQLYSAFSYAVLMPLLEDMLLAREELPVAQGATEGSTVAGLGSHCVGGSCPLCRTADAPGRWLARPDLSPRLARTCPPGYTSCHSDDAINASPRVIDDTVLRWQPYGCSLRPPAETPVCRERLRRVCFFGDSHMRHLYNAFVDPTFNTNATTNFKDKIVLPHPTHRYQELLWGTDFHAQDTAGCSYLVVNFGQWALSHVGAADTTNSTTIYRPWPAKWYLEHVNNVAKQLQGIQSNGTQVWWVTTFSMPYQDFMLNMTDFRTDPYLTQFNSVAYDVMRLHAVPVIDTYTMTDALQDLTYDALHYKGYVGHWAAAAVAHELCGSGSALSREDRQVLRGLQHRRLQCHWQGYSTYLSLLARKLPSVAVSSR